MEHIIRKARLPDVPHMVGLSEQKRTQYEKYQPAFWRKAEDSREQQTPYFESLLEEEPVIALVHEQDGKIDGFIIATLVSAPSVYDPGGLTCMVDDFVVSAAENWQETGVNLLKAVMRKAKDRGAVQGLIVCGHLDQPKRTMLQSQGFSIASEWYVREI